MADCVTKVSIMQDVWDSLGLHGNKKDLKSGKKRLCYGQFTNGRLRDSSEYHVGCIGFIRASLEPKRSKIGQETADLWPIYQWEVVRLQWESFHSFSTKSVLSRLTDLDDPGSRFWRQIWNGLINSFPLMYNKPMLQAYLSVFQAVVFLLWK